MRNSVQVEVNCFLSLSLRLSRPGSCAGDGPAAGYKSSTNFPDETLTFIKSYPLMDEAVPSVNNRPCFTRTTSRYTHTNTHAPIKIRLIILILCLRLPLFSQHLHVKETVISAGE